MARAAPRGVPGSFQDGTTPVQDPQPFRPPVRHNGSVDGRPAAFTKRRYTIAAMRGWSDLANAWPEPLEPPRRPRFSLATWQLCSRGAACGSRRFCPGGRFQRRIREWSVWAGRRSPQSSVGWRERLPAHWAPLRQLVGPGRGRWPKCWRFEPMRPIQASPRVWRKWRTDSTRSGGSRAGCEGRCVRLAFSAAATPPPRNTSSRS